MILYSICHLPFLPLTQKFQDWFTPPPSLQCDASAFACIAFKVTTVAVDVTEYASNKIKLFPYISACVEILLLAVQKYLQPRHSVPSFFAGLEAADKALPFLPQFRLFAKFD